MSYCLESTTALTALADAVRAKTSTTASLTVSAMASAVSNIPSPLSSEYFHITDGQYVFYKNNNAYLLDNASSINFDNLSNTSHMFDSNQRQDLSNLTIPLAATATAAYMFQNSNVIYFPTLTQDDTEIEQAVAVNSMFQNCANLRTIPSDYFSFANRSKNVGSASFGNMFFGCYSLLDIPDLTNLTPQNTLHEDNCYYYRAFYNCYCLDKIENLPIQKDTIVWQDLLSFFGNAFYHCERLKKLTFPANRTAKCSGIIIDLSTVGYGENVENYAPTGYGKVAVQADYNNYKNTNNWYATTVAYSRYNHDSAVETINSLPNASAYISSTNGSTNTIKFKGDAGSSTDGGAISTLTAAEIAVATNKGWTVALV